MRNLLKVGLILLLSRLIFYDIAQAAPITLSISPKAADDNPCPGNFIDYSVQTAPNPTTGCLYLWTVENGIIEQTGTGTYTGGGLIGVRWNNTTAKGKITVTLTGCSDSGTKTETYTILSLNGQTPTTSSGNTTVNVGYCATSAVFGVKQMQFPGTSININTYEWIIPSGWRYNSTQVSNGTTPFPTTGTVLSPIPANCGGTTVRVRGVSICDGFRTESNWLTINVNRTANITVSGPSSVGCSSTQNVTYTATALACATYTWTLPSGWTGSSTTNTISVRPNGTTGGTIRATANVCGATPSGTKAVSVDILASISGTGPVCSSKTFTLTNSPSNVTWSVSPTSLFSASTRSGTGTSATVQAASSSSSGAATISFVVQGCGQTKTVTKSIWVGKPRLEGTLYHSSAVIPLDASSCVSPTETFWVFPTSTNQTITSYQWSVAGGTILSGQGTTSVRVSVTGNPAYISVRANNSCGASTPIAQEANKCFGSFSIYPNPANEQLTVEQTPSEVSISPALISQPSTTNTNSFLFPESFSVKLYNDSQEVVIIAVSNKGKVVLDTNKLPTGIYFLHIYNKEAVLTKQVIIQ